MSHEYIIRAWRDEEYRMSLSEQEQAGLPENPVGLIELTDIELELIGGGYGYDSGSDAAAFETTPCTTSLACPKSCGQKKCNGVVDDSSEIEWLM